VTGIVKQILSLSLFHNPAKIHDGHMGGNMFHHSQVVADKQIGQV
jgi:hypothetical protein